MLRSLPVLLVGLLVATAPGCATRAPAARPAGPAAAPVVVRAGTSGDYPPLSTWTEGRPGGFAPALLTGFAVAAKVDLAWTRFRWPDLQADVSAGRFDVAADGITVLPDRSVTGVYTVPVAQGGAVLLLRRPAWAAASRSVAGEPREAARALDRPELRVAVNRGGHLERVARALFRAAEIRPIDGNAVRDLLAGGEVDAAMTNTFEAPRWAAGIADVERIGPLTRDVTALWLRADREDLAERLDAWLLAEEESGRLAAERARWLGADSAIPTARPLRALFAATAERLALMPLVAGAKERAGTAIEDAAQESRVLAAGAERFAQAASALGRRPPSRARIDAFFRAQIEAAKAVQRRVPPAEPGRFSLDRDLRPAIARITRRIAFVAVRLPARVDPAEALSVARDELAESGLEPDRLADLARAVADLAPSL
jgi:cyclohexadienyl dehydratase